MNISKKTSYAFLVLSALLTLLQCALAFFNFNAALITNLSTISFGIASLLLMMQSRNNNKILMFCALVAFILTLAGMISFAPFLFYGNLGILAWPALACFDWQMRHKRVPTGLVIISGLIMFVISCLDISNYYLPILALAAYTLIQVSFAYDLFKLEEDVQQ